MTEKRTPTHCPHCGYEGSFDGLGVFTRRTKILDPDQGKLPFMQTWFQYHCPECEGITAMLENEDPLFIGK